MRAGRVALLLRSVVEGLTSSSRRVWWTSFVVVTMLAGMWGVANPPFAGPDEPAHVIRAHALAHGQLTGDEPSARLTKSLRRAGEPKRFLVVRAPEVYPLAQATLCFPFDASVDASCLFFERSNRDMDIPIYTARHPPAYYAVIGVVSWFHRPGAGTVYLMRFVGALITGAFLATAITALRRSAAPKLVAAGLLLAFTPMVLFVSGVVNASAPEIAASLALWVCGLILISGSHERVDKWLVTAVGIAGCVLALSRQLGPLWLGLIALTMLGITNRRCLVILWRSHWARLWGGLIAASALVQVAWDAFVKPLDVAPMGRQRENLDTPEILRNTFGASLARVRDMVGTFGWLDTPSPTLTWVPWIAAVGFLFFLAVMLGRRRVVAVLIGLLAATIVVPALIESAEFGNAGGPIWQGRYTLPLAIGIPLLATIAVASTEGGRQLPASRVLLAVGIVVGVAHVLAFAQNLRRYTVGYDGEIQYWKHPEWSPPVSPLLLTIGYTIVIIGFVWLVFASARGPAERAGEAAAVATSRTLAREPHAARPSPRG
jgi:Predicted membrane protein (DUF2142)